MVEEFNLTGEIYRDAARNSAAWLLLFKNVKLCPNARNFMYSNLETASSKLNLLDSVSFKISDRIFYKEIT